VQWLSVYSEWYSDGVLWLSVYNEWYSDGVLWLSVYSEWYSDGVLWLSVYNEWYSDGVLWLRCIRTETAEMTVKKRAKLPSGHWFWIYKKFVIVLYPHKLITKTHTFTP